MKTPYQKFNETVQKARNKLYIVQAECSHPEEHLKIKYEASSGYAEPTRYWKEYSCGYCGKWWKEDQ